MSPISPLPDLVQGKIRCIMRFMHYDVMHYELINCISLANMPCQQKEWWTQELLADGVFLVLPNEMQKEIVDNAEGFPIGLDKAKGLRVELNGRMEEVCAEE